MIDMDDKDRLELKNMLSDLGITMDNELSGVFIKDISPDPNINAGELDATMRDFVSCIVKRSDGVTEPKEGSRGVMVYSLGLVIEGLAGVKDGVGALLIDIQDDGRVASLVQFQERSSIYSTVDVESVTIMDYQEDPKACCTYFKFGEKSFCFEVDSEYGFEGKCPFVYVGEDADAYYSLCLEHGEVISGGLK